MASAQGSVRLRSGQNNTADAMVETYNTLHNAIVASGMIQVADDEYLGQAGVFSLEAGPGLTQIVKRTGSGEAVIGFKVYRHPTLPFYIKVNFTDFISVNTATTGPSVALVSYQLAKSLNGAGGFSSDVTPILQPVPRIEGYYYTTEVPTSVQPFTVSCGTDHFWISRKAGYKAANTSSNNASFGGSGIDPYGIGVFSSSKSQSVFCIVLPQALGTLWSENGFWGESTTNATEPRAVRYRTFSDGVFANRVAGAAGSLPDPSEYATENGIRVAQGELNIGGTQHRFNFAFCSPLVVPEFNIVGINLVGTQSRYQSLPAFGSCGPSYDYLALSQKSILLFPLSD